MASATRYALAIIRVMAPMPTSPIFLFANVLRDLRLIHKLSIAIDEQHLMAGRGQGFEQKHPEVRHEVPGHTVVGVVEQNSHDKSLLRSLGFIAQNVHDDEPKASWLG
jgi:hypothetical protein